MEHSEKFNPYVTHLIILAILGLPSNYIALIYKIYQAYFINSV